MHYNRKAAAIFILVLTLILPMFLEAEEKVAVVELDTLITESKYLSTLVEEREKQEVIAADILKIIKKNAAEFAVENNYSSVIIKRMLYKGGEDISLDLAKKIDAEN